LLVFAAPFDVQEAAHGGRGVKWVVSG
jgi:hypothetical protein